MLRRATDGPQLSRAELKVKDERKDTILLLVGSALVIGFLALSLELTTVAVGAALLFGLALLKTLILL